MNRIGTIKTKPAKGGLTTRHAMEEHKAQVNDSSLNPQKVRDLILLSGEFKIVLSSEVCKKSNEKKTKLVRLHSLETIRFDQEDCILNNNKYPDNKNRNAEYSSGILT